MSKKSKKQQKSGPVNVKNKKAYRDYELIEKVEAGIELVGTEVKSLRQGQADLDGSYARVENDQCWLVGAQIAQYAEASYNNHDPLRQRRLLLHKRQILKIKTKLQQRGFTLVPLRFYFNDRGYAKVELALAKGKRKYDKRDKLQKEQQKRDIARSLKHY
ncbi:SsrA-binding protein SmpB [Anaerohalosphaera lusitana]|nr:SsrA-binding protein SmpB [Anaerohalosphaera lusitana]